MSRATRALRITKNAIKYIFILLIAAICIFFVWRVISSENDPSPMKTLSPNAALAAAYEKDPTLAGTFRQEQRSITSAENNYGYFSVTKATFIPAANQIQIVVRYNNSTLRYVQEDLGLDQPPTREEQAFDVSLLLLTDVTPDDDTDNLETDEDSVSKTRIHPTYFASYQKSLYNYRLFVFDLGDLSLSEHLENGTLLSVFADIYYIGAVDYEATPYGTLCLYDYITETIDVKLSSADKKALNEWKQ